MDWYEYSVTYLNTNTNTGATGFGNTVVNYTKLRYDLEGMTTETKVNEQVQNRFMAYDDTYTQVETIMQLCQAFVIIGVVLSALLTFTLSLCFFDGLRNKFLFWIGMGTLRIVVIITVFFIVSFNFHNCNGCIILRNYKPISIVIVIIPMVVVVIVLII